MSYVYPEWSGLNQVDESLTLEEYLESALSIMRNVWLENEQRKSPTHLARLITGSECILVIGALETLKRELDKHPKLV